jgi:hypothetical protein
MYLRFIDAILPTLTFTGYVPLMPYILIQFQKAVSSFAILN